MSNLGALRVGSERLSGAGSLALGIWIDAGTRDEHDTQAGYAHLVEHLLFKGGPDRDAREIARFFDGIGTDANAVTSREATVVSARFLPRHLGAVVDVFGEMVAQPAFRAEDVDREREVVLEEIAMYLDSPADVCFEAADELCFPDHPLSRPVLGSVASVGSATGEGLALAHADWYGPERMVVAAAGDVDHDELLAAVQARLLPRLDGRSVTPAERRAPADDAVPAGRVEIRVVRRPAEQAHVALAVPAYSLHDPRRYALLVLDAIAGSMNDSRLFERIREREGLAYSVHSWATCLSDTGQFGAYVGVRPDRLERALQLLSEELTRLAQEPVSAAELARAKDYLEGRTLLGLESSSARADRLGAQLTTGVERLSPAEQVARIQAVDGADVTAAAADILGRGWSIAIVADDESGARRAAEATLGDRLLETRELEGSQR